ncbi:hypothetical protein FLA_3127 [Filimonas lacunae]|nr:hypothetical protein FLA_3127 [Filimonas lacunae]
MVVGAFDWFHARQLLGHTIYVKTTVTMAVCGGGIEKPCLQGSTAFAEKVNMEEYYL